MIHNTMIIIKVVSLLHVHYVLLCPSALFYKEEWNPFNLLEKATLTRYLFSYLEPNGSKERV